MVKKIVFGIVSIIAVLIIAVLAFLEIVWGGFIFLVPSYNKINTSLKANIDELSYVADVLYELEYDTIVIRKFPPLDEDKYNMDVSNGSDREIVPIPDELLNHVEALYKSGIRVISSGRDSVEFTMWYSLSESRGMIYSRTGEKPDENQLIEVRQLSKKDWYYYVSNFEKAKARNPQLFQ